MGSHYGLFLQAQAYAHDAQKLAAWRMAVENARGVIVGILVTPTHTIKDFIRQDLVNLHDRSDWMNTFHSLWAAVELLEEEGVLLFDVMSTSRQTLETVGFILRPN